MHSIEIPEVVLDALIGVSIVSIITIMAYYAIREFIRNRKKK